MNIALTGGIGSGKSCVAGILGNALGFPVVSTDLICRSLMEPEAEAWKAMRGKWPETFFHPDGAINRPFLRDTVFRDADLRRALEDILHPLVRQAVKKRMVEADKAGEGLIVEVPLLFEVGWQADFDCTVAVYASRAICLQRIARRDAVSIEQAQEVLAAQMDPDLKAAKADYVVNNSGLWVQTAQQVYRLGRQFRQCVNY